MDLQIALETGTDHLYVLGDEIDRGKHGIAILQKVARHPNITMIMGNHEHVMLEYLEYAKEKYGYFKDIRALIKAKVVKLQK